MAQTKHIYGPKLAHRSPVLDLCREFSLERKVGRNRINIQLLWLLPVWIRKALKISRQSREVWQPHSQWLLCPTFGLDGVGKADAMKGSSWKKRVAFPLLSGPRGPEQGDKRPQTWGQTNLSLDLYLLGHRASMVPPWPQPPPGQMREGAGPLMLQHSGLRPLPGIAVTVQQHCTFIRGRQKSAQLGIEAVHAVNTANAVLYVIFSLVEFLSTVSSTGFHTESQNTPSV